ncbi:hypothetical protein FQN57_005761 [Myotisia sp. PD_48]|nr:hypothetical protein FQN57_005761 [Myotisia sp. PD_48]
MQVNELDGDSMGLEYEGSYIYKPVKSSDTPDGASNKRRKLGHDSKGKAARRSLPFIPLLSGKEEKRSVELRYALFQDIWSDQERKIQAILQTVDADVVDNIAGFVKDASRERYDGRIPCGMISVGSNISSTSGLFSRLQNHKDVKDNTCLVSLVSRDAPTLKTALKTIIKLAVSKIEGAHRYKDYLISKMGLKLLAYDLDILLSCIQQNGVEKIVIAFGDSEAFDSTVLTDLITLFGRSWLDRIPFVLLFGVATSVSYLESRLPRSAIKLLQGQLFDFQDSGTSVDHIFLALQMDHQETLWLGHNVSKILMESAGDRFQSPERFSNCLKYVYMAHFFANPLSVLLAKDRNVQLFEPELCEAIRNTASFQRHVEELLNSREAGLAKQWMTDDTFLTQETQKCVEIGQEAVKRLLECVKVIVAIINRIPSLRSLSLSECIIIALSGNFSGSKIVQELIAAIPKLNSDDLESIIDNLPESVPGSESISNDFSALLQSKRSKGPLRSKHDPRHVVHNTTVVGQRVKLTKGKAQLSKEDTKYTELVEHLHDSLESYLREALISPTSLFMHECFLYDSRSPIRYTFTPRCRFTIENALSSPFHYLESKDAEEDGESLSEAHPPVSILYQLYSESGSVVNLYDLWQAFYAILSGGEEENCEKRESFALFYQALSELKMMGMARSSRKKTDHLAKSAWMGL